MHQTIDLEAIHKGITRLFPQTCTHKQNKGENQFLLSFSKDGRAWAA